MKIGIDISQVAYEGTGVARYVRSMIDSILEFDLENEYTFFFSSLRRSLPGNLEVRIKEKHSLVTAKLPPTALDILWNQAHVYPIEKFIGKQDVFISSDWTQPPCSAKRVTVVHDLVFMKYPETVHKKILAVQKRRLGYVKKEADMILADSQATKDDLVKLLDIHERKIRVLYPAVTIPSPLPKSDFVIPSKKYVLSVGKLEPRKNIPRLIEAFEAANLLDADLLIVGPTGWGDQKMHHSNRIKFLGFVPDEDLYELYRNALCFVYPSLYEGFGYPVVEAMALGCPVATSNTSSLHEISQNVAIHFDPTSEEDIQKALSKLVKDESVRKQLIKVGKERALEFNRQHYFKTFITSIIK